MAYDRLSVDNFSGLNRGFTLSFIFVAVFELLCVRWDRTPLNLRVASFDMSVRRPVVNLYPRYTHPNGAEMVVGH